MTQINPRVSIIIPVFNGANYLEAAIESAIAQTYKNLEIIIIDDGSTDRGATEAIARSFGDAVRYFKKENGGVSSALNFGISSMTGKYFSWLSHDDIYYPEKIQHQIEYIQTNSSVMVLATGLDVINSDGQITSSYTSGEYLVIENGRDVMDNWVYGCSLLINREVFDFVGLFNERNRTLQDLEMWLKIVHAGHKITMMPNILCQWRHHGESDSFKARRKHLDEVGFFLQSLPITYSLGFFSQKKIHMDENKNRVEIWGWLGQQALSRGQCETAAKFYRNALFSYQNPLDTTVFYFLRRFLLSFFLAKMDLEHVQIQEKLGGGGLIRKALRRLMR